ncbi:AAA family ATPase [Streptosporangiaceae bacterium NEAU-GS5]|nr:AAA family ATPase [Streptosporangiaceae bacterium NEAU-GS5]
MTSPLRLRVLGSLDADVGAQNVPLGGPRQRAVLALLLTARGDVVSVDRMIEDLWRGEPPAKAIASLQSYVANLRRLLEPGRPPRAPARILVSAAPGYALRLDADSVDAWTFERRLQAARALNETDPHAALDAVRDALAAWRGDAFAEFADEEWAVAEATRLAELRLTAQELLVAATLRAGSAADAVPVAEMLTRRAPLREEGWRLLALALWGGARQADALAALRRARRTFADELGLDPGPALVSLEEAILTQDLAVLAAATTMPAAAPPPSQPRPEPPSEPRPAPVEDREAAPEPLAPHVPGPGVLPAAQLFVGREPELRALTHAAADVLAGRPRVVLISGEPGAGKSALLARLQDTLADQEGGTIPWLVTVGRCPETEGAPAAWAWIEALRPLASAVPPRSEHEAALAPLLRDEVIPGGQGAGGEGASGRFRLHQAVAAWLREAARDQAVAIVLDDLHRADIETLGLLTALADGVADARVLLVAALRPSDVTETQEDALAALARHSPVRLPLAGLSPADVETLVAAVCERPVDAGTMASLAERTGGNPFYVREIARLLDSEGPAAAGRAWVPEGVRDVLRRRLARLPVAAVSVLRLAAVVGREADVEVLVAAADADEDTVLDALEAGVLTGLLTEPSPGWVRFTHALVRDTLYQDLSQIRVTRMHARVADALAALHPGDLSALAHHYARAATTATAQRAVDYAVRAAEQALRRYAHDVAVELFTQALDCFARVPDDGAGDRLAREAALLGQLVRAKVMAGDVAGARATRQRAIDAAEGAGREELLVEAFTSWTEATPWLIKPYATIDERAVGLLTRLLRRTDLDLPIRCRLLDTLAAELESENDPRGRAAARELAELTAGTADPHLRALNLVVQLKSTGIEVHPERVAPLTRELAELTETHDMVAYRWYAEYMTARVAWVLGHVDEARAGVARSMEIARAYQMTEAIAVGWFAEGTFAHVAGRLEEAERLYDEAAAMMRKVGSIHVGAHGIALLGLRVTQARMAELVPRLTVMHEQYGHLIVDMLALVLLAAGRTDEARQIRRERGPLRHDYYFSAAAAARGLAVAQIGDPAEIRETRDLLLPLRDRIPGASSMSTAMLPVAHILGDLALALGEEAEAAGHYRHALEVAERFGAAHWAAGARAALARLGSKTPPSPAQEA